RTHRLLFRFLLALRLSRLDADRRHCGEAWPSGALAAVPAWCGLQDDGAEAAGRAAAAGRLPPSRLRAFGPALRPSVSPARSVSVCRSCSIARLLLAGGP